MPVPAPQAGSLRRLSTDLLSIMTGIDLSGGSDYSTKILAEETSKGNDYNEERFSDYMFDQNDYTLSDGSHVKVSTAYDYVWTGSDGNVYYSNSALDMPSGATQLYPNRQPGQAQLFPNKEGELKNG